MSEEKISEESQKAVISAESMKNDKLAKPTPKDAARFFVIMSTLFFAILGMCSILSMCLYKDGFAVFFGGFFVIIPLLLTLGFSLPAVIIGTSHKAEKDSYKLFMWIGIITMAISVIGSAIVVMNTISLIK